MGQVKGMRLSVHQNQCAAPCCSLASFLLDTLLPAPLASSPSAQVASFTGVKRRLDVAHTARRVGACLPCGGNTSWVGRAAHASTWTYLQQQQRACSTQPPSPRHSPCSVFAPPLLSLLPSPLSVCSESRDSRGSVGNAADSGEVGSKGSKGVRKGPTGPRGELSLSGPQ